MLFCCRDNYISARQILVTRYMIIFSTSFAGHHMRPRLRFGRTCANFFETLSDDRLLFAADLAKAANVPVLAKKGHS